MHNKILETIESTILLNEKSSQIKLWRKPIIEIISAKNEKLKTLREIVSPEHLMPEDILPGAKSIISFFIPFGEDIVNSNIIGTAASREWAIAYIKTNILIAEISDAVELSMMREGFKTGKIPATHNFDTVKLISKWSHRHVANIAGIGSFGLHNMLITKSGCCGRLGSIITDYELKECKQHGIIKERCLNKLNNSCGQCQKRCIADAYENNNFSRQKCYEQCLKNGELFRELGKADVCGKCLVGLPCSLVEPGN